MSAVDRNRIYAGGYCPVSTCVREMTVKHQNQSNNLSLLPETTKIESIKIPNSEQKQRKIEKTFLV